MKTYKQSDFKIGFYNIFEAEANPNQNLIKMKKVCLPKSPLKSLTPSKQPSHPFPNYQTRKYIPRHRTRFYIFHYVFLNIPSHLLINLSTNHDICSDLASCWTDRCIPIPFKVFLLTISAPLIKKNPSLQPNSFLWYQFPFYPPWSRQISFLL